MQLKKWIEETGHTPAWLAKEIGVSYQRMCRVLNGLEPTLKEVDKIYSVTHRKVTWRDFLEEATRK